MKTTLFLLFSLFFVGKSFAQAASEVQKIEEKYQLCLDEGVNMLGCTNRFYTEMDSVLNSVYNTYRATLAQAEKDKLKAEQKAWLTERDAYFKKQNQVLDKNNGVVDFTMKIRNENAIFVKKRV